MLDMHVIQPVPPAMEPPVVKRMAAQLGEAGSTGSGMGWPTMLVIGLSGLALVLSYTNCVQRGACKGFRRR